jgi:hypothetical protein
MLRSDVRKVLESDICRYIMIHRDNRGPPMKLTAAGVKLEIASWRQPCTRLCRKLAFIQ